MGLNVADLAFSKLNADNFRFVNNNLRRFASLFEIFLSARAYWLYKEKI